MLLGRQI